MYTGFDIQYVIPNIQAAFLKIVEQHICFVKDRGRWIEEYAVVWKETLSFLYFILKSTEREVMLSCLYQVWWALCWIPLGSLTQQHFICLSQYRPVLSLSSLCEVIESEETFVKCLTSCLKTFFFFLNIQLDWLH